MSQRFDLSIWPLMRSSLDLQPLPLLWGETLRPLDPILDPSVWPLPFMASVASAVTEAHRNSRPGRTARLSGCDVMSIDSPTRHSANVFTAFVRREADAEVGHPSFAPPGMGL